MHLYPVVGDSAHLTPPHLGALVRAPNFAGFPLLGNRGELGGGAAPQVRPLYLTPMHRLLVCDPGGNGSNSQLPLSPTTIFTMFYGLYIYKNL